MAEKEEREILEARDKVDLEDRVWMLKKDKTFGRHLVASRDLGAGELVLSENPLIWGPNNSDEGLVCVACNRSTPSPVGCPLCDLPLCQADCHQSETHRRLECKLFKAKKDDFNFRNEEGEFSLEDVPYASILIIRILVLLKKSPDFRSNFLTLEPLLSEWQKTPGWEEVHKEVFFTAKNLFPPGCVEEEEIQRVVAICCTNTFCKYLRGQPNFRGTKLRVCYLLAAMISHSCVPNCEQSLASLESGMEMKVVTTKPIKKGEQLFISYIELLSPTILRQSALLTSKLFICTCPRCVDTTKFGSMSSAVRCTQCAKKNLKSHSYLLASFTMPGAWECSNSACSRRVSATSIREIMDKIEDECNSLFIGESIKIEKEEMFLKKYSRLLHPSHGILIRTKYNMAGHYGRLPGYKLEELSDSLLQRKKDLCEEVIKALEVIEEGSSARRGMTLYELHVSLLVLGKKALLKDPDSGRKMLLRSLECLEESLQILKHEPQDTFGGDVHAGGIETLPKIQQFIMDVIK